MKALVYAEIGKVAMEQREIPAPGPGEVLVRVAQTGICGSDVHGFLGHSARRKPGLILGHETTGWVESLGSGVSEEWMGRRVAVNPLFACQTCRMCRMGRQNCCRSWQLLGLDQTQGAFAERVTAPARNLYELPNSVTASEAVMIEPLANAMHLMAFQPARPGGMPSAVLFGFGTLGACIFAAAKLQGYEIVAVVEPNPRRAAVARSMGAPLTIDPTQEDTVQRVMALTGGEGVPVAFDAVGRQTVRQQAAAVTARGGTVLLLGLDEGPTSFDFHDILRRELRLQTSFAYTETDFAEAHRLVCQRRVDFREWTDVVPLADGQAAFERLVQDPGDRLKIALEVHAE